MEKSPFFLTKISAIPIPFPRKNGQTSMIFQEIEKPPFKGWRDHNYFPKTMETSPFSSAKNGDISVDLENNA